MIRGNRHQITSVRAAAALVPAELQDRLGPLRDGERSVWRTLGEVFERLVVIGVDRDLMLFALRARGEKRRHRALVLHLEMHVATRVPAGEAARSQWGTFLAARDGHALQDMLRHGGFRVKGRLSPPRGSGWVSGWLPSSKYARFRLRPVRG